MALLGNGKAKNCLSFKLSVKSLKEDQTLSFHLSFRNLPIKGLLARRVLEPIWKVG
jgi:hypothetical protein